MLCGAAIFVLVSTTFDVFKPLCASFLPTARPSPTSTTTTTTSMAPTANAVFVAETERPSGAPPTYSASVAEFGEQFWAGSSRARRSADYEEDWFYSRLGISEEFLRQIMPEDHPFWAAVQAHRFGTTTSAATPSSTIAEPSTFTPITTTTLSAPPASAPEADEMAFIGESSGNSDYSESFVHYSREGSAYGYETTDDVLSIESDVLFSTPSATENLAANTTEQPITAEVDKSTSSNDTLNH
ncbi:unnamed protein product [Oikopleura dioica]|uniref:Uncharacterized protein n=1 Tax=Oikopleura dioica TaxID=34765 RepID=E4XPH0_OIKDI|nr:unnamed protein product [Oikopleura dioica]CBY37249.1 unnamed protein product [Oikopleura dioica]